MFSENAALFEPKFSPCKFPGCSRSVKEPFHFCYNCNMERKKLLTGRCGCGRAIKPDFSSCYGCFQKQKSERVVGHDNLGGSSGVQLRETVDAIPYEPKSEGIGSESIRAYMKVAP